MKKYLIKYYKWGNHELLSETVDALSVVELVTRSSWMARDIDIISVEEVTH